MFDEKTQQHLETYVYLLIDPANDKPFYVGKGKNNRVFEHMICALKDNDISSFKYDKIREILANGKTVKHVIVRHGLSDDEAFQIEASLIDTLNLCGFDLSNLQGGHNSIEKGLMTSEEIIRIYNAKPLDRLGSDCVLININKTYKRGVGEAPIYQATKETWFISEKKIPNIKYVLSEFRGQIVEVFEVIDWYKKLRPKNRTLLDQNGEPMLNDQGKRIKEKVQVFGFGFNGIPAPEEVRNLYINKSVAHIKKKGSAQVIRYRI